MGREAEDGTGGRDRLQGVCRSSSGRWKGSVKECWPLADGPRSRARGVATWAAPHRPLCGLPYVTARPSLQGCRLLRSACCSPLDGHGGRRRGLSQRSDYDELLGTLRAALADALSKGSRRLTYSPRQESAGSPPPIRAARLPRAHSGGRRVSAIGGWVERRTALTTSREAARCRVAASVRGLAQGMLCQARSRRPRLSRLASHLQHQTASLAGSTLWSAPTKDSVACQTLRKRATDKRIRRTTRAAVVTSRRSRCPDMLPVTTCARAGLGRHDN